MSATCTILIGCVTTRGANEAICTDLGVMSGEGKWQAVGKRRAEQASDNFVEGGFEEGSRGDSCGAC